MKETDGIACRETGMCKGPEAGNHIASPELRKSEHKQQGGESLSLFVKLPDPDFHAPLLFVPPLFICALKIHVHRHVCA